MKKATKSNGLFKLFLIIFLFNLKSTTVYSTYNSFKTCYTTNSCNSPIPSLVMNKDTCDTYISAVHLSQDDTLEFHNIKFKIYGTDKNTFDSYNSETGTWTSIVKFNTNKKYNNIRITYPNSSFTPTQYPNNDALLRYTAFIPDADGKIYNELSYVMYDISLDAATCIITAKIKFYHYSSEASADFNSKTSLFKRFFNQQTGVRYDMEKNSAGTYNDSWILGKLLTDNMFCN